MTRRPPDITSVLPSEDGGLSVHWAVDTFFGDSEPPERVRVDLNGLLFQDLGGDEDSVDVPGDVLTGLGGTSVVVSVSFWWAGPPAEEQQSSVAVALGGGAGPGQVGVWPAMKPVVTLAGVQGRTPTSAASITIRWRTNNHNDGNIFWGPMTSPRSFVRNIRPANASVVTGTFTTDRPIAPNTLYSFTVEVRNTLHSPGWLATTLVARSAKEVPAFVPTTSVRQFLQQTGRPVTTGLAGLVGPGRNVRSLILG